LAPGWIRRASIAATYRRRRGIGLFRCDVPWRAGSHGFVCATFVRSAERRPGADRSCADAAFAAGAYAPDLGPHRKTAVSDPRTRHADGLDRVASRLAAAPAAARACPAPQAGRAGAFGCCAGAA